jgi:hypothetical protein
MTASDTPNSATEQKRAERLDVARTAYHALAVQDANRVITLCDIRGRLIALAYRSKQVVSRAWISRSRGLTSTRLVLNFRPILAKFGCAKA